MEFRLVAGAVDDDGLFDGVDQPGELCSVGDPLEHLGLQIEEVVAGRTEFDDEVWADRGKSGLIRNGQRVPSAECNPGGVGSAHGAIGKGESPV